VDAPPFCPASALDCAFCHLAGLCWLGLVKRLGKTAQALTRQLQSLGVIYVSPPAWCPVVSSGKSRSDEYRRPCEGVDQFRRYPGAQSRAAADNSSKRTGAGWNIVGPSQRRWCNLYTLSPLRRQRLQRCCPVLLAPDYSGTKTIARLQRRAGLETGCRVKNLLDQLIDTRPAAPVAFAFADPPGGAG